MYIQSKIDMRFINKCTGLLVCTNQPVSARRCVSNDFCIVKVHNGSESQRNRKQNTETKPAVQVLPVQFHELQNTGQGGGVSLKQMRINCLQSDMPLASRYLFSHLHLSEHISTFDLEEMLDSAISSLSLIPSVEKRLVKLIDSGGYRSILQADNI